MEEITTPGVDFTLYDAADSWDFPAPEFIIDTILPNMGTVWVGGLPKRGKSLLVLYLGLAIACERPDVFEHFKVQRYPKILYVTREDGGPRLQERRDDILAAWGGARPIREALKFAIKPRIDLLNAEHVAWLRDMCILDNRTVIVLDTWTALSPGADPLSAKDQAMLAAVVVQLAEDIRGLVIVVDHSRKNRPEGSILSSADIFGAPQKWAAAEHVIMVDHAGSENRWEIFVEGKDTDSARFLLTKSPRGSGEEKLAHAGDINTLADRSKLTGNANRQQVLDVIRGAWLTREEVETKTGMSKTTCYRHLTALVESGEADQAGSGRSTRYRAVDTFHPPSETHAEWNDE